MRLKQYITESDMGIEEIWSMIQKDCKPFLKEFKLNGHGDLFFRGTHHGLSRNGIKKFTPRKDRRPTDTPELISKMIDDEFKKKVGWKPRSEGVFTTTIRSRAGGYGETTIFFPIGKYKYVWSDEIIDLYTYLGGHHLTGMESVISGKWNKEMLKGRFVTDGHKPGISFEQYAQNHEDNAIKNMDDSIWSAVKTFKTNDMASALRTDSEVVFGCNEYYLISKHYMEPLREKLV